MPATHRIGEWYPLVTKSTDSPEDALADYLTGGDAEWREAVHSSGAFGQMLDAYRDEIASILPEGVVLSGKEVLADVDAAPVTDDVWQAIRDIDLGAIVARFDPA